MKAIIFRGLGIAALLLLSSQIWPQAIEPAAIIPASLWILFFYTLLRPFLLTLLLPLNMLVLGLLTPLGDALFIIWAAAWTPGFALTYWQGVGLALLFSLSYWPYAHYRRQRLFSS